MLSEITCLLLLTAKLTLIAKSECSADDTNAATDDEAEKFLEADVDEEKKMETDAAEDADNLVCHTGSMTVGLNTYFAIHSIQPFTVAFNRVFTAPGNLLEFDIPPGSIGNLLKFNRSSWKIFMTRRHNDVVLLIYVLLFPCSTVFLLSSLDGTVMSVGRSSSSHAQLEIVHTLLVVVILLIKL